MYCIKCIYFSVHFWTVVVILSSIYIQGLMIIVISLIYFLHNAFSPCIQCHSLDYIYQLKIQIVSGISSSSNLEVPIESFCQLVDNLPDFYPAYTDMVRFSFCP